MTGTAESAPNPLAGQFLWEACLGNTPLVGATYYEGFNGTLCEILKRPPVRLLELGCAAGRMGEHVKKKYPGAHVTGIEMNAAAAEIARTRIDRVIVSRLEDIDFDREGIAPGSIDTFIAGDVLEHMYDPWRALARVKPLLTPDAQVALSIPNVRNLHVMDVLNNEGSWKYATHGLLDITHIRFFAFRDCMRLLDETGFAMTDVKCNIDPRYAELFRSNLGKPTVSVQLGRLRLDNLNSAEFQEYCTLQYILLCSPKGAAPSEVPAA
jgi:O-antigen biosynthesis protein